MSDYRVESCQISNTDEIESRWLELQQRSECSYFQSWGWIGAWLEQLAYDLNPFLVTVWQGNHVVGLGIFIERNITRHRILASKALYLNESPFDGRNMVIEYNGLLAANEHQDGVYKAAVSYVLETFSFCDEVYFSAICEGLKEQLMREDFTALNCQVRLLEQSPAMSVNLGEFDHGIDDFLNTLSKNRKAQIRRSIKLYEKHGPIQITESKNIEEALLFFDGLKDLHIKRWQRVNSQGAFSNSKWERFHRHIINARFDKGEIQLLRVSNAQEVIGFLYNFIWHGHVYVLQTGFSSSEDKRLMPGYVAHVLAIAHNKEKGLAVYDLMHGDAVYKKILCDQSENLYWLVVQKKKLKFFIEDSARMVVRTIKDKLR